MSDKKKLCDECEEIDQCVENALDGNAQCLVYGENSNTDDK